MNLIVDASVALAWAAPDEESTVANDAMLHVFANGGLVPSHWALEVSNSLLVLLKRKRIDEELLNIMLRSLQDLQLDVDVHTSEHAFAETVRIARAHDLTIYDAAYLELALRTESTTLATLGRDLAAAAERSGVTLFPPTNPPRET